MEHLYNEPGFWSGALVGAVAVIVLAMLIMTLVWLGWRTKIEFYLYFADEDQAKPVVAYLKRRGFKVESRLSADEQQWLVLAIKAVRPWQLDGLEAELESLAKKYGGEFDGFERAI